MQHAVEQPREMKLYVSYLLTIFVTIYNVQLISNNNAVYLFALDTTLLELLFNLPIGQIFYTLTLIFTFFLLDYSIFNVFGCVEDGLRCKDQKMYPSLNRKFNNFYCSEDQFKEL